MAKKSYPKNKKWAVDSDYKSKLSDKDKEWLDKFEDDYYGNGHSKSSSLANSLTDAEREQWIKTCNDNNNAMNRDLYAINQCVDKIDHLEQYQEEQLQGEFWESITEEHTYENAVKLLFNGVAEQMIRTYDKDRAKKLLFNFYNQMKELKRKHKIR